MLHSKVRVVGIGKENSLEAAMRSKEITYLTSGPAV